MSPELHTVGKKRDFWGVWFWGGGVAGEDRQGKGKGQTEGGTIDDGNPRVGKMKGHFK